MPSKIDPPCIGICTLNDKDICIGCGRTVQEIHEAYLDSIDHLRDIMKKEKNGNDRNNG